MKLKKLSVRPPSTRSVVNSVAVLGAMAGFVFGLLVENGKMTWRRP
jgi:hypothetical protein